ncbi:MAG: extensin family protein [Alphaproteobacteria bacterium]|nr:extensin family protein [Alphaproteobacteria bacterium]
MARAVLALSIAAALAACAPRALAPPPAVTGVPSSTGYLACQQGLSGSGAMFEALVPLATREGCGFAEGVKITATPSPLNQPAVLSCPTALALTRFDLEVVQPAALQHFGKRVVKIHHVGGYTCRGINGGRKWSQHAFGNAIDVIGFDLADGTRITVGRDWRAGGAPARFLHDIARGACQVFRVVLTPAYDKAHQDHFHLDLGPERLCGI